MCLYVYASWSVTNIGAADADPYILYSLQCADALTFMRRYKSNHISK